MSINEFDKLLNEKFNQHEFAYDPAAWEQLSGQLPQSGKRRVMPFTWIKASGIAAALAITVSGVAWYYHHAEEKYPTTIADSRQIRNPHATLITIPEKSTLSNPSKERVAVSAAKNNNTSLTLHPVAAHQITVQASITAPVSLNDEAKIAVKSSVEPEIVMEQKVERSTKPEIANQTSKQDLNNDYLFEPVKKTSPGTLFSLTGGMNYGAMSTGYAAGINAKHKIGSKLFVEGDLAFVNNKTSQSFTQQQQQMAAVSKSPIDYEDAHLMYIQLNPTLGYQVMKNLSLGIGADIQKLVNDDNTLVNVNDEVKTIPGTDFGLTGKTELSLSKRFKAGILYREGMNNLLKNSSDIFDRRYLQVQLKFIVAGK